MFTATRTFFWVAVLCGALVRADHPESSPSPTSLPTALPTTPCPDIVSSSALKSFVDDWLANGNTTGCPGVNIGDWDTSQATDMSFIFRGASTFNEPLTSWKTSIVTNMDSMFEGAAAFNQPVNHFNTYNVINMESMFEGAVAFNQPLGDNFFTNSVINMKRMFHDARTFDQNLDSWSTKNVQSVRAMFAGATAFNGDISLWDATSVTDASYFLFNATSFDGDLTRWGFDSGASTVNFLNHTQIADKCYLHPSAFAGDCDPCPALNDSNFQGFVNDWVNNNSTTGCPLKHIRFWDTGNVTRMNNAFQSKTTFNDDISLWDVSNVVTMDYMFDGAYAFNQVLSPWVVGSLTSANFMFSDMNANQLGIWDWDTSSLTQVDGMFWENTQFNENIGQWNVANVYDFSWMFYRAEAFNQDISGWNVSKGQYFNSAFEGALSFNQDLSGWDMSGAEVNPNDDNSILGKTFLNTSMSCRNLLLVDYYYDINASFGFGGQVQARCGTTTPCVNNVKSELPYNDASDGPPRDIHVAASAYLKYGADSGYCNVTGWETSEVTDMSSLFSDADAFNADISNWTTTAVTDVSSMFAHASAFDRDISGWDVSGVDQGNFEDTFLNATSIGCETLFKIENAWDAHENWNETGKSESGIIEDANASCSADLCIKIMENQPGAPQHRGRRDIHNAAKYFAKHAHYYAKKMSETTCGDEGAIHNNPCLSTSAGQIQANCTKEVLTELFVEYRLQDWHFARLLDFARAVRKDDDGDGNGYEYTFLDAYVMLNVSGFAEWLASQDENLVTRYTEYTDRLIIWDLCPQMPCVDCTKPYADCFDDATKLCTDDPKCIGYAILEDVTANFTYFTYSENNKGTRECVDTNLNLNSSFNSDWNTYIKRVTPENTSEMISVWDKPLDETYDFQVGNFFCNEINSMYWYIRPLMGGSVTFVTNPYNYCPIDTWNTDAVVDMQNLFRTEPGPSSTHQVPVGINISGWNTTSVTTMRGAFENAVHFNGEIGDWDTGRVEDMSHMFAGAASFNHPLNWNTGRVEDMSYMFAGAASFNHPLNWNTGRVRTTKGMFGCAAAYGQPVRFNGNISGWETASVNDMSYMFSCAPRFDGDVSSWNVSNVTTMEAMFGANPAYGQTGAVNFQGGDLSGWETSSVTNTDYMFGINPSARDMGKFTGNVLNWDTGAVTSMKSMFAMQRRFNEDIGHWETSNVVDMSNMFLQAQDFNQDLHWNTGSVTSMKAMFRGASIFNRPIDFDTSSVTNMSKMFSCAMNFNQNISGWATDNVHDMSDMFSCASQVQTRKQHFNQPLDGWNTSMVTNFDFMFAQSKFNQPLESWDVSRAKKFSAMFAYSNFNQSLNGWGNDMHNAEDVSLMFYCAVNYAHTLEDWSKTIQPKKIYYAFGCYDDDFSSQTGILINPRVSEWNFDRVNDGPLRLFIDFLGTEINSDSLDCDELSMYHSARTNDGGTGASVFIGGANTCSPTMSPTLFPTATPTSSPTASPTTLDERTDTIIQRDAVETEKEIVQVTGIFFGMCFALVLLVAVLGVLYRRFKIGKTEMALRGADLRALMNEQKRRLLAQDRARPPPYSAGIVF